LNLKNLLVSKWLTNIVVIIWIVSLGFVVFLLSKIDYIVNHDLYNYGLQFSSEWAFNYWVTLRSIYVCLFVPIFSSTIALAVSLWKVKAGKVPLKRVEIKSRKVSKVQQAKDNHMGIICPNCKKVFSKPLIMLDFSSGKAKLVNVCPYCGYVLGSAEKSKGKDSNFEIVDFKKKLV